MRRTATALVLVALGGASAGEPAETTTLVTLREDARTAMKPCGHCHDATQKSAIPSALRAFDLDQVEWATTLAPSKLGCMDQRFGDLKVPEAARNSVKRYLEAEWAHRQTLDLELRAAAREALETSCGRCHDRARPTARPAALRIFDLHEEDWAAGVTLEQMEHMVARFEGFKMPPADRATVQRFFDAERARRASLPSPAPTPGPTR